MKLEKIPSVKVSFLPTPLEFMPNLTKYFNNRNPLYIKRDDCTGLAFGGNKARKLDYLIADALENGYTTLLTYGGPQTNNGRQIAAAAARFGMKSIILADGIPPKRISGNILLDLLFDCDLRFIDTISLKKLPEEEYNEAYNILKTETTKKIINEYEAKGEKVYVIPAGSSNHIGILGYVNAMKEIVEQIQEKKIKIDYIVCALGSGGTCAGLYIGKKLYADKDMGNMGNMDLEIINISVSFMDNYKKLKQNIIKLIKKTIEHWDWEIDIDDIEEKLHFEHIQGAGYDIPDKETREAIHLLARTEGILLDPCYTGKAFLGLCNLLQTDRFSKDASILFLHTGGTPALYSRYHLDGFNKDLKFDAKVYKIEITDD